MLDVWGSNSGVLTQFMKVALGVALISHLLRFGCRGKTCLVGFVPKTICLFRNFLIKLSSGVDVCAFFSRFQVCKSAKQK